MSSLLSSAIETAAFFFLLLLWNIGTVSAGGYAIPHQTARGIALSNAVTAGVDDPSAVYYNPAALTEIKGNKMVAGLTYINVASNVENSGSKSVNKGNDHFLPSFFVNYHIPKADFTVGLGMYSPFGLGTSYDDDAITRFAVIEADLKPVYFTGAAGWKVSDSLSLGAGVGLVRGSATLSRAVFLDALGVGVPDGKAKLTGTDEAFAFSLGLLAKPTDKIKLGLAYRNRTYLKFEGAKVKFVDFDGAPTRTKVVSGGSIVLPSVVSAGIYWQMTPRWSLEFVYDWTKWDDFESFNVRFGTPLPALGGAVPIPGLSISAGWKSSSTLRLGTLFHLDEQWDLMAGIGLDESPIPAKTLSPIVPGADILTLNGGVSYTWKSLKFTVGYMAVLYKTRRVQNNVLEAEAPAPLTPPFTPGSDRYTTFINFLAFNVLYRF